MTPQEMIDYAFGGLDEPRREQVDLEIVSDPVLAASLERMRTHLDLMLDDGDPYDPPPDLAQRTLLAVQRRQRATILDFVPASVPFRLADVAVAAGIFLAGLATLLPAVQRTRIQNDQALCAFNLGQLGRGLTNYAQTHGIYPYPKLDSRIPYAGTFKNMLKEAGQLWNPAVLDCPANGHSQREIPIPDCKTLCSLKASDPREFLHMMDGDYAYHLGYRRPTGEVGPVTALLPARIPLLADQPGYDDEGHILEGNSPNHGGVGQNILYSDGHVTFHHTRLIGPRKDDVFLNDHARPEAGVDHNDAVLAPGCFMFFESR
jgi:hypothetical protein